MWDRKNVQRLSEWRVLFDRAGYGDIEGIGKFVGGGWCVRGDECNVRNGWLKIVITARKVV